MNLSNSKVCSHASTLRAHVLPRSARGSPLQATRREVLNATALAGAACTLASPPNPAQAAYVDEQAASSVFQSAVASVAAIEDFRTERSGAVIQEGVGSGFVWDTYGHVVTNYHCISKLARDQNGSQVRISSALRPLCGSDTCTQTQCRPRAQPGIYSAMASTRCTGCIHRVCEVEHERVMANSDRGTSCRAPK